MGLIDYERLYGDHIDQEDAMSKRARKRRSRKGNAANHGRKPNA